ncbi:MAG: NTP transferase domain-containing protein [Demequina sp.]|nr:NTP transferase domain-containing protein [Demequina sp.]
MAALTPPDVDYAAIVLSGGRARRLGGASKPDLVVGGEPLLVSALKAAAGAAATIVVGPPSAHHPPELTTREDPPGGGPVAAIAAGLGLVGDAEWVLVLACDTPRAAAAVPVLLAAANSGPDAVVGFADGHRQPLLALYRRDALASALAVMDVESASMRALLDGLDVVEAELPEGAAKDLDTWEDVEQARREFS